MLNIDVAELKRPIQTLPEYSYCGDATLVIDTPDYFFLALFDGAGHGYKAYTTADLAINFIKDRYSQDLLELLFSLHEYLKKTPGGVLGLCRVDKETGQLTYTGIGDVTIRLFHPNSTHLVIRGGILGHGVLHPVLHQLQLWPGNILIMHSDGVDKQFLPRDFPNFFGQNASMLARIIIDYCSKILDDASVIILKVNDD